MAKDRTMRLDEMVPGQQALIEAAMKQVMIILVARLGGEVKITIEELDTATVGLKMEMEVDNVDRTITLRNSRF